MQHYTIYSILIMKSSLDNIRTDLEILAPLAILHISSHEPAHPLIKPGSFTDVVNMDIAIIYRAIFIKYRATYFEATDFRSNKKLNAYQ